MTEKLLCFEEKLFFIEQFSNDFTYHQGKEFDNVIRGFIENTVGEEV